MESSADIPGMKFESGVVFSERDAATAMGRFCRGRSARSFRLLEFLVGGGLPVCRSIQQR